MPKNTRPAPKQLDRYLALILPTVCWVVDRQKGNAIHSTHPTREEAEAVALALNALSK